MNEQELFKIWDENGRRSWSWIRDNVMGHGLSKERTQLIALVEKFKTMPTQVTKDEIVTPLISIKKEPLDINNKPLFLKQLEKMPNIYRLTELYNTGELDVLNYINKLRKEGINIICENGLYFVERNDIASYSTHEHKSKDKIIRFGVVSDTHLGNKCQQITYLRETYKLFKAEGLDRVYHVGDISDGLYPQRGEQRYELFKQGFDEQAEYIIENYPDDVPTYFITGNHDSTHVMNGGANIGKKISNERKDMHYLGSLQADVMLTDNCKMELRHPLDGSSYAVSYKPQKYIESMAGGTKPNLLLVGHYHKQGYFPYRNVHCLLMPSFEAQTPFLRGKGLVSDIGGIIITLHISADGTINRFIPEFIPYYKPLKNDY